MRIRKHHSWDLSPKKAIEIQKTLQKETRLIGLKKQPKVIAGADASFRDGKAIGIVSVFSFPDLILIETIKKERPLDFPYVPGLLAFRESPVLIDCFRGLSNEPDLIIFDGHGISHFRGMGIATHLGLILKKPTIGCAKKKLFGVYEEPHVEKGSFNYLKNPKTKEKIGAVVRTKNKVKPLFISPGNLITLDESIQFILDCTTKYRLPEPTRIADKLSKREK